MRECREGREGPGGGDVSGKVPKPYWEHLESLQQLQITHLSIPAPRDGCSPHHPAAVGTAGPCPKPAVPSSLHSQIPTPSRHSRCFSPCSGLIPRLLGDILSLWLCNMLAYLINTYALENGVGSARGSGVPGADWEQLQGYSGSHNPVLGGFKCCCSSLRSPP